MIQPVFAEVFVECAIGFVAGFVFVWFILMPVLAHAISSEAARAAHEMRVYEEDIPCDDHDWRSVDEFTDNMNGHVSRRLNGLPFRKEQ